MSGPEIKACPPVLGAEAILGYDDRPITRLHVPEWGGFVCIRALTAGDWDEICSDPRGKRDTGYRRARFVAHSLCDENGARIFTLDDVEALAEKSAQAVHRLEDAAYELNGMGSKAQEQNEGN